MCGGVVLKELAEGIDGVAIEAFELRGVVVNNEGFTGADGVGGIEVDVESVAVSLNGIDRDWREISAVNGEC